MKNILKSYLEKENFHFKDETIDKFEKFLNELEKWNKKINLVSYKDKNELIKRHLLDSLYFIHPINHLKIKPKVILDVGSGAGFPGIPLSIVLDNINFFLVEIRKKRALFLEHIKRLLNLSNTYIRNLDIRQVKENPEIIVCRAFAPLDRIETILFPFLEKGAKVIISRGKNLSDLEKLKRCSYEIFSYQPKEDFKRNFIILYKA